MAGFRQTLVVLLPRLRRFAIALSGSAQEAEDLVQTAVERALKNEAAWAQHARLDSVMFKVIENLWIDEVRSARRRLYGGETPETTPGSDGRATADARLDLADVRRALDLLSEDQRAVVALVVLEGMAYKDVAETLSVPIGTVMSRLSRARASLSAALIKAPEETEGGALQ